MRTFLFLCVIAGIIVFFASPLKIQHRPDVADWPPCELIFVKGEDGKRKHTLKENLCLREVLHFSPILPYVPYIVYEDARGDEE